MRRLEAWVTTLLQVLELLAIVIALFVVLVILLGIARSMARVTLGKATLVLPFTGDPAAAPLHRILVEQIGIIERDARRIYGALLATTQRSDPQREVDVGPLSGKALHEFMSSDGATAIERAEAYVLEEPVQLAAVSRLSFGGVSVSPESIFAVSYFLRRRLARRSIRGSLDKFDGSFRLAITLTGVKGRPVAHDGRPRRWQRARSEPPVVLQRKTKTADEVLEIVDDIAFQLLREKYGLRSETGSWSAWTAFQEGYLHHVGYLNSGERQQRAEAVALYQRAIQRDARLARAHYNLGNLLYDEYLLASNQAAIEHFIAATESDNAVIKALAYAGLTMAYAQNVHRFELEPAVWIEKAESASKTSTQLAPDLEEAAFARAWSLQISDRFAEAVKAYDRVVNLTGDSPSEVQVKSFALNNEAYLYLHKLDNPERAEELLLDALQRRPNKNLFANLGELRRRQGRFSDALDAYREARRLDPMYTNGINETGMVYLSRARALRHRKAERSKAIDQAYRFHLEALSTVAERSEKDRLRRSFERHRISEKIRDRQARRWSDRVDRLVSSVR